MAENRLDPAPPAGEHGPVTRSARADVLSDFEARGLIHDTTDRGALARALSRPPVTVYLGIDPSADSLHIGHLLGVLALRRFQLAGHRPIALAGGATGMIGDPSGRSEERNLLDPADLAANLAGIEAQLRRLLLFEGESRSPADSDGDRSAVLVDNASWTRGITLLEFLRDVGKHVTVNQMLAKESVRSRIEGGGGISFTEFSYMLIQANDFVWLHEHQGCELQIGGSDQWGNITTGIDLVRRRTGHSVHGLTWPLLTRSDGTKFGKTATGNIWLDAERTSPYAFYQHWMQVSDVDVRRLLLQLTLLRVDEVEEVIAVHGRSPEARSGQRRLAFETTALVHGVDQAVAAQAAAEILFGTRSTPVPEAAYRTLEGEVTTSTVGRRRLAEGIEVDVLLVETGLSPSRNDARRQLAQGAVYVNGERAHPDEPVVSNTDLRHQRWILLRRGKREHRLVRAVDE